ncbi:MAG: hypothetical protein PF569_04530 [Candidatus Woesearchaeota archaeon]|jgi:hypothetical protein|nr:hypothetical protein [Candidatus Woesearchaeota archaeon]
MTITTPEEEALELKKEKKVATKAKPKVEKKVEEKPKVPMGYITVKLDSLGKLSAPFELHFRDYSIEEVLELSSTNDDMDNLEAMVKVLNNMILEDFDCGNLVFEELMEILYTLQGAFYSGEIERRIIIDEKGDRSDPTNYVWAFIPLGSIDTKELDEKFKEPFTLSDSKTEQKIVFRLPRIKDKLVAEDYLKTKYSREIRQYSKIYHEITTIEAIKDSVSREEKMEVLEDEKGDEVQALKSYLLEKMRLLAILTQGLSIISINGKELDYGDCEELLEIIPTISRRVWESYTKVVKDYSFGLVSEVTFYLPEAQESVTRRLRFRPVEFLPDYDSTSSGGITVSFSD